MAKQLKYKQDARDLLVKGVNQVATAVTTTLGPKGRNVALDKKWGAPTITHDGVSVAKEIELADPFENMGAQLIKEAAEKTSDKAGDGTTTATAIAASIINAGMEAFSGGMAAVHPMVFKDELEEGVEKVMKKIKEMAKPVKGDEEIEQIANISAQDSKIGSKIAEALKKVGPNGVVTVEEGKGLEVTIDYKEGMEFDKGYVSPYFVTNTDTMEAEIENPAILITDQKISAVSDLLPFLENVVKKTKNLVIIADEIEGEALATLVVNKLRGAFNVVAVKAPGFGDRRKAMLEDIAVLTGGSLISEDTGRKLDSVEPKDCGYADKVWTDKENCRIIGGKGDKKAIQARIASIKNEMETSDSEFDTEKLEERLAKLSGGVAIIEVGAASETEMEEKKSRVKNAVAATKAAIEEGIVSGGGIALLQAREVLVLEKGKAGKGSGIKEHGSPAWAALYRALAAPTEGILRNAEVNWPEIYRKILKKDSKSYGYDVIRKKHGDMFAMGVIDPVKVVRLALENAASIALMVLTTDALVTDLPEKEEKTPAMPPGGGMPGGMGM